MAITPFDVRLQAPTHVVIEMFGGDNNLSAFVNEDLEEARRGIEGPFAMLAFVDRVHGEAEIIEVSEGRRTTVERVGEVDTGDPRVLANFLARSLVTYRHTPRIAIGFWDHGTGVFDEQDDAELILRRRPLSPRRAGRLFRPPAAPNRRAMLHDDTGGLLTTREAGAMIEQAFVVAAREQRVDVVFSDTCLNGMLEVSRELGDRTEIVVASEELEPGDGWDYYHLFRLMSATPPPNAAAWASQMIEAFSIGYVDRPDQHPCTLAGFRSDSQMIEAFATLVSTLSVMDRAGFRDALEARMKAQAFTGSQRFATIDLLHFATVLRDTTEHEGLRANCTAVVGAVETARVANMRLGASVGDANGIAFWFPASVHEFARDRMTYEALRCAAQTGWSRYLERMLVR